MTRLPFRLILLAALCLLILSAWTPVHAAPPSQTRTFPAAGEVTTNANLRAGPGTTYAKVGGVNKGQTVTVTECNDDCTWYHLDSDAWIAASLVDLSTAKPAAAPAAAPTARPSAPAAVKPTANAKANLRSGPGQQYSVVGSAAEGETLDLVGRSADSGWYATSGGEWISTTLVANAPGNLPVKAAPKAAGIGWSRRQLQAIYEPWGFVFSSSPLLDGRERVMADVSDTMVELIGPAADVEVATVIAFVSDDTDDVSGIILHMLLLPGSVLPDWNAAEWLATHLEKGVNDPDGNYEATIRMDGKQVQLSVMASIGSILLSIEPAR